MATARLWRQLFSVICGCVVPGSGLAAVETGNGGGVGAELALGLEEQDVGGQDSVWRLD